MDSSRRPRPPRNILTVPLLGFVVIPAQVGGTWQDEIGYSDLRARLGNLTPLGEGIAITQVESSQASNYLPEFGPNTPIEGTGGLLGKSIFDASNLTTDSGISDHARNVANFIYSNNPGTSLARGITEITVYEAQDWLGSGFLSPPLQPPYQETSAVQNHSWIGSGSNSILRRFDYAIVRDGFTACVGLNNGPDSPFPDLLASSYNSISIGRSDGFHSTGGTPPGLDGPGRTKPEIVVPQSATSWATAIASAAAALLLEVAKNTPGFAAAEKPETIKAILMSGATKHRFPAWTRTPSRPVDHIFGAGQLNIDNSHQILVAGNQPPGSSNIPTAGWTHTTISSASPLSLSLAVPEGYRIAELVATAAWNRAMIDSDPGPAFTPSPVLPDLSLTLDYAPPVSADFATIDSSVSSVDNFEHLYLIDRPAGTYTLSLTTDRTTAAAVAWRYRIERQTPLTITSIFRIGDTGEVAIFWTASQGRYYTVQKSADLRSWVDVPGSTALPASPPVMVFIDTSPPSSLVYYRVVESVAQASP